MLVKHRRSIPKQSGRLKDATADERCARRKANCDVCNGDGYFECGVCGVSTVEGNGSNNRRCDDNDRILKMTTNMLNHGVVLYVYLSGSCRGKSFPILACRLTSSFIFN